jgi:molybdopterin synthase sulfur carrier subunit
MKITIIAYAIVKEQLGSGFSIEVPDGCTIAQLRSLLSASKPEAGRALQSSRFAINETFAGDNAQIDADADVHILPPSSGG